MKLITTFYTAVGLILAMFCIVTAGYLWQTKKVRKSIDDVLYTANLIREGEQAQKLMLDMETGFRGYLLTGNKEFLIPYYKGKSQFTFSLALLDSLTKNHPRQNRQIQLVRKDAENWINSFATPLLESRAKTHLSPKHRQQYDSLFQATAQQGTGKKIMDQARTRFEAMEKHEEQVKLNRLGDLNFSLTRTNEIAIGLTLISILAGGITAYLFGKTVRKRFRKMNHLAYRIAQGDYNVSLEDKHQDEISSLTHSLNVMARKLRTSFNHLTKMNKELDQFAYVVSHDLKAPLRAINNLAEWIAEDLKTDDPDILNNLTILRGRVLRMENLINGILDYSRVGRQALPPSTFSTQDLLKETLENLAPAASFQVKVPAPLPTICGERTLFYQVLSNLLSNAFKYHHTQEGVIVVSARELPDFYQFEVRDDGPGIAKEYHSKVFGIFQTMHARDVKESTGIGLSIVKKIIEEKGGQIWIESEKGQGTAFFFTWPKQPETSPTSSFVAHE